MGFCPSCGERNDLEVKHSLAELEYYQLANVPEKISTIFGSRKVKCKHCEKKFKLERLPKNTRDTYRTELLKPYKRRKL